MKKRKAIASVCLCTPIMYLRLSCKTNPLYIRDMVQRLNIQQQRKPTLANLAGITHS